jgi:hypothetical protein
MTVVSPELALVDPSLRSEAVAGLPPLEAFDFLRFDRRPPALSDFGFLAEHEEVEPVRWRPPLLVAASIYAASSLARVVVMDGLFVLGLAAAVVALNLIG